MEKPPGLDSVLSGLFGSPVDFEFVMADAELAKLIAVMQFQGYDPIATYNELCRRAQEKKVTPENFRRDMFRICVWFMLRGAKMPTPEGGQAGPNQGRSVEKTSDAAKAEIKRLKEVYGLVNTQPKQKTDINIGRVIGCFPHIVASLMAQYPKICRIVSPAGVDITKYGCPTYLLFPQGISLIPTTGRDEYVAGFVKWAKDFDLVVNKGKPTPDTQLQTYIDATWNSKLMKDATREAWLEKLTQLAMNAKNLAIPTNIKAL